MNNLNQYLKKLEVDQLFSGNILIVEDNQVVFQNSYGYASLEHEVKNKMNTKFKIASITKTMTAYAILILNEEKALSINDNLSKYLPDYPKGDCITLYHLLTHSSGIPELLKLMNIDDFKHQPHTLKEIINRVKKLPLDFKPGTKFNYSNTGYHILAYIIEQVSGLSYEEFMNEKIFKPLNMKNTGCFDNKKIIKDLASGYSMQDNRLIMSIDNFDPSLYVGAGNIYTTVNDLILFLNTLKTKITENKLIHIEEDFYAGYGCIIHQPEEIELIYQDGGSPGVRSVYMIYPKKNQMIIFFSNFDFVKVADLAQEIEKIIGE